MDYKTQLELLGQAIELCRDTKPKLRIDHAATLSRIINDLKTLRTDIQTLSNTH